MLLTGTKRHLRARRGLADRRGIVGVVDSAVGPGADTGNELRGDDARVQAERDELARVQWCALESCFSMATMQPRAAGGAPGDELVARQGAADEHAPGGIDRMHLEHALGRSTPTRTVLTSCNLLVPRDFQFNGSRLMTSNTTNLGASSPLPEGGSRIPLERDHHLQGTC